jgi:hypothetical protein
MRVLLLAAAALVLGVTIAGCGGKSNSPGAVRDAGAERASTDGGGGRDIVADIAPGTSDASRDVDPADASPRDGGALADASSGSDGGALPPVLRCPAGLTSRRMNVVVQTDADLAALTGIECIEGNLSMQGATVTSLAPLSALQIVTGALRIENSTPTSTAEMARLWSVGTDLSIYAFRGSDLSLPALRTVGATLSVGSSPLVTRVSFSALESVGGTLSVAQNSLLGKVEGSALRQVATIEVTANAVLTSLDLPLLGTIKGGVSSASNALHVQDNPKLEAIRAPRLTSVGGVINVQANNVLATFDVTALTSSSNIAILQCPALQEVSFPALLSAANVLVSGDPVAVRAPLLTATGMMQINNQVLSTFRLSEVDLGSLDTVTDLRIYGPVMTKLTLTRLRQVNGALGLFMERNTLPAIELPALEKVVGRTDVVCGPTPAVSMPKLKTAGGVRLASCSALKDLSGLATVEDFGPFLHIETLPKLNDLSILRRFTTLRELRLSAVDSLATLSGLESLVSFTSLLEIAGAPALTDIGALKNLTSVANLRFSGIGLTSLQGLEKLATADSFWIQSSSALVTARLPALTDVQLSLVIQNNDALTALEVPALARVSEVSLSGNKLTTLALPAWTSGSRLVVVFARTIARIEAPLLPAVTDLDLEGNSLLTTLLLPRLAAVSRELKVTDNPRLPTCRVTALQSQLTTPPTTVTVSGNDSAAACP